MASHQSPEKDHRIFSWIRWCCCRCWGRSWGILDQFSSILPGCCSKSEDRFALLFVLAAWTRASSAPQSTLGIWWKSNSKIESQNVAEADWKASCPHASSWGRPSSGSTGANADPLRWHWSTSPIRCKHFDKPASLLWWPSALQTRQSPQSQIIWGKHMTHRSATKWHRTQSGNCRAQRCSYSASSIPSSTSSALSLLAPVQMSICQREYPASNWRGWPHWRTHTSASDWWPRYCLLPVLQHHLQPHLLSRYFNTRHSFWTCWFPNLWADQSICYHRVGVWQHALTILLRVVRAAEEFGWD